jgi:hypothetical protein
MVLLFTRRGWNAAELAAITQWHARASQWQRITRQLPPRLNTRLTTGGRNDGEAVACDENGFAAKEQISGANEQIVSRDQRD